MGWSASLPKAGYAHTAALELPHCLGAASAIATCRRASLRTLGCARAMVRSCSPGG